MGVSGYISAACGHRYLDTSNGIRTSSPPYTVGARRGIPQASYGQAVCIELTPIESLYNSRALISTMEQAAQNDNTFLDPNDKFWSLYIADAEKHDKIRLERWKGDTDGILIFTGLFAATVATFVVTTIPNLSPDAGDQTVDLLSQMLVLLANQTDKGSSLSIARLNKFEPSISSLWINSLWLSSLSVALFCALAATLVQQWSRVYSQGTQRRGRPSVRGPVYARLAEGIERFRMEDAITLIVSLLHLAVGLFFAGLLVMLLSTNRIVAIVLSTLMTTGTLSYVCTSIIPVLTPWSPYRTPLSLAIKYTLLSIAYVCLGAMSLCKYILCLSNHEAASYRNVVYDAIEPSATIRPSIRMTISDIYKWLGSRSAMVAPEACTPLEQMTGQRHAIKQVIKSVDELHEVEQTCESLIPIFNTAGRHPDTGLALSKLLVRDLNAFDLLAKLAESHIKLDILGARAAEGNSRRIIIAISLTCSLVRCGLPSRIFKPSPHETIHQTELDDAYTMLLRIENSRLLSHLYNSRSKTLANQKLRREGIHLTLDCFLATLRVDVLVVIAVHAKTTLFQDETAQRLMDSLASDSEQSWLRKLGLYHTGDMSVCARQLLLDNCLWIYDRILSLCMENGGLALLDDLEHFWVPRVEHVYKVTLRYHPRSELLRQDMHDDLDKLVRKLGLHLASNSDFDLNVDWDDTRTKKNPQIAALFDKYPRFKFVVFKVCNELKRGWY